MKAQLSLTFESVKTNKSGIVMAREWGIGCIEREREGGGKRRLISLANEKRTFGRLNINILPNFDPVEKEEMTVYIFDPVQC